MKLQKRFTTCMLVIMIAIFFSRTAFASSDIEARPLEISNVSKYADKTEARLTGTPRGRLLSSVSMRLTDEGNGTVKIYADMLCHVPLREMLLWIYLEKWDSETKNWVTEEYQHFEWKAEDYPDEDLTMAMISYHVRGLERGQDYRLRGMFGAFEVGSNYQETWTAETATLFVE